MTNTTDCSKNGTKRPADAIRNMRLAVWREWEKLWSEAMAPGFTGTISLEVRVENGVPKGSPRFTRTTCGVTE